MLDHLFCFFSLQFEPFFLQFDTDQTRFDPIQCYLLFHLFDQSRRYHITLLNSGKFVQEESGSCVEQTTY